MNIEEFLKLTLIFFYAVILHECAHGWIAYKLGDPTAKLLGRLTLNPVKHVDPIGTVLLPIMLLMMNSPVVFGWAKPVPVNFMNLRHPKRDMIWVGLGGPFVNILLALFFSQFLRIHLSISDNRLIESAIMINLVLAIFNLMPIPPLDGSRLIMGLLPGRYAALYGSMERFGILIVLLLLYAGLLEKVVWPAVHFLAHYLGVP